MLDIAINIGEATPCYEWDTSGCCCKFLPLNEMWGIKGYTSKEDRDWCVKFQEKSHRLGFGPMVGVQFEINISWLFTGKLYCYLTELADTRRTWTGQDITDLYNKMKRNGIANPDLANRNVGMIGNRLVCIDFDCCQDV